MIRSSVLVLCAAWLAACEPTDDSASAYAEVSELPRGVGAIVHDGGVLFRVWAPGAIRVFVAGQFSDWKLLELSAEADDHFARNVAEAEPGQMYKFVLRGSDGRDVWIADPRARQMEHSAGASIIHSADEFIWWTGPFEPRPLEEQVIYEMHIGTFNDAPGGPPGTYASAGAQLDALEALGVNMIELLPVFEFAGDWSWGYNPAYPFAPESVYGSPDDLKWFVDEAHARGIGVIFDVVHNHWGRSDLPSWCFEPECADSGNVYTYPDERSWTPWGPRPDYRLAPVRSFIRDNVTMLVGEYHGDGLRWDATKFMRRTEAAPTVTELPEAVSFLRDLMTDLHADHPGKPMIAEDLGGGDFITRPVAQRGLGFDSQWQPGFGHVVMAQVAGADDAARDVAAVRDAITQRYNGSPAQRVIYIESHDEVANGKFRFVERIEGAEPDSWLARKKSTLAASILLTSPGVPMLFQGQEVLEDGSFADTDPVDWAKKEQFAGIWSMYRDLIRLRRNLDGWSRGLTGPGVNVFHVNQSAKLLAFHRYRDGGPGDDVVVVANLSGRSFAEYTIGMPRAGTWSLRFNSDARRYADDFANTASRTVATEAIARDGLPHRATVAIGPYSLLVLSQ